MVHSDLFLWTFVTLGVLAILAGGFLSAFSAKKPSRLVSWASAYLVLIVGLAQAAIGMILYAVVSDPVVYLVVIGFVTYNLGSAAVVTGTLLKKRDEKYRWLVDVGGGLLVVSMLSLAMLVQKAVLSWQLVALYIIIVVILVTMPLGLVLSRRRK